MTFLISKKVPQARIRGSVHGPELQRIATEEASSSYRSLRRTTAPLPALRRDGDAVMYKPAGKIRSGQISRFANRGTYWESIVQIPEPHQFAGFDIIDHGGHPHRYETQFIEHDHGPHEHGQIYGRSTDHENLPTGG